MTTGTQSITQQARALLISGRIVCTRSTPSGDHVTAWAGIAPLPVVASLEVSAELGVCAFAFEIAWPAATAPSESVENLLSKRATTFVAKTDPELALLQAADTIHEWGANASRLIDATLDAEFPLDLVATLLRTPQFGRQAPSKSSLSDRSYALLFGGRAICAEVTPSSEDLRAWVHVRPDRSFRAPGSPVFRVYAFEVRASSIEAGYDVVGELLNEREADISGDEGFDRAVENVESVVRLWGLDPSRLIDVRRHSEYPL